MTAAHSGRPHCSLRWVSGWSLESLSTFSSWGLRWSSCFSTHLSSMQDFGAVWTIPMVLPFLEASSFLLPSHESFWNSHSRLGFVLTQLLSHWPQWFRFVLVSESGYSPSADSLPLLLLCWALKCVPVCLVNVCVQLWVPEASSFQSVEICWVFSGMVRWNTETFSGQVGTLYFYFSPRDDFVLTVRKWNILNNSIPGSWCT